MKSKLITFVVALVSAAAAFVFAATLIHSTLYASDGSQVETIAPPASGSAGAGSSGGSAASDDAGGPSAPAGAASSAPSSPVRKVIYSSPVDPSRLIIPALGVNANVQYIGVNAKGNLGIPDNFTDVGWYALGTAPGQNGTAVIDGHVDNGLSLAGVFKHLDSLEPGDDIYVTTAGGATEHFVVATSTWYGYTDPSASAAIFSPNGGEYLKLITCGGAWVAADRTYDHRLVVTAVLATTSSPLPS